MFSIASLNAMDPAGIIEMNTRQHSMRKMTWFKKDEGVKWCSPEFDNVVKMLG
jgi:tRNA A37 N6-isopentenylltransferase MiaA